MVEVRPVSLRDIRLAERERDRDARQLQQQARTVDDSSDGTGKHDT